MDNEKGKPTAKEVLLLDSSTFIEEIGLTSRDASALRHHLRARETQLVVPQVVVEECERHLRKRADEKKRGVLSSLGWLARFCGSVNGWTPPTEVDIAERSRALSRGETFDAVVLEDTPTLTQRADERVRAERPPSHRRVSLNDCRIWEHCLELLKEHNVILVSKDADFRGHRVFRKAPPAASRGGLRRVGKRAGLPSQHGIAAVGDEVGGAAAARREDLCFRIRDRRRRSGRA